MGEFKNLYSFSKTLRFGLVPYGKTSETIKKSGILEKDKHKADIRRDMQKIIDEKYKDIIEKCLEKTSLDINLLVVAASKDKKNKEKAKSDLKKSIVTVFKKEKVEFKPGDFIKKLIQEHPDNEIINTFNKFSTYFTNFFEIRKHIFTGDSPGSIAYRLIDDNLTTFLDNIEKINKYPEALKKDIVEINDISNIKSYNSYLTQAGITRYNEMIGGISGKGDVRIQGINVKVNQYCQKNKIKLPILKQLSKMILSDEISNSFIPDLLKDDEELIKMLNDMLIRTNLPSKIDLSKPENIYLKYAQLGNLPHVSFSVIRNAIIEKYDSEYGTGRRRKTYEKDRKKNIEAKKYSIKYISDLLVDNSVSKNIEKHYKMLIENFELAKKEFLEINWSVILNIRQSKEKEYIKDVLDSLKTIQRFYNLFEIVEENINPDSDFYAWLFKNITQLGPEFNEIYNKARNYMTKKQYSQEKFRLNFDNPQLANGWDVNKEIDNSAFIMRRFNDKRKNYDYFLGIWKKDINATEKETPLDKHADFEKMQYKFYPDPSKMLPKQFMSDSWKEKYPTTKDFEKKYKNGHHKKGEDFDKMFLHQLIDRFKHGLINHEEKYQETFNFRLRETKDYNEYTEFLEDISRSSYKVTFEKIADIAELIDNGKLFVFRIYSKDFSEYSKGTKNLNTIYFESLFSEENLKNSVFKLSGGAEVFYRPASLKYDNEIMKKGHHYEKLKDKFDYPIIKDRRYSQDKYFLHVPIVINFNSDNLSPKDLNNKVISKLDDFTHIIGIDRGERHLVYLSVVEIASGKIVEQKHLDEIVNIDAKGKEHPIPYLSKLEEKSKTRDDERKSWETIESIKELKEGYISQVVNEIRNLQEKYNALIILENLNYGFKNSRIKVEKQIYQKFETALIKKFNYIIDKKNPETYLAGKQLTNPITTLDKIGNQSGIVIYIPAWNTSNIDPVTGFVNLFYSDDLRYKNQTQAKEFINKIDRICYEYNEFKFDIDFSKWNSRYQSSKQCWTLTSYGNRIYSFRNVEKNNNWDYEEINLTERFKKILNTDGTLVSEDVKVYKEFLHLFKLMVSLRNSVPGTDIDYIISPVADENGLHFDSRKGNCNLPKDADANGAYNIARKGLMVVENLKKATKNPFKISNEDYLKYIQNK